MTFLKHLQAILLLPGMAAVALPAMLLSASGSVTWGGSLPQPWRFILPMLGIGLVVAGLFLMVRTISLFVTVGKGTLAPWTPTQKLVVRGIYRHVRNPMITGVFCILAGESATFGSLPLLYWFFTFVLLNAVYIPLVEEPGLEQRFGEDYRRYKKHVPRWIPRLHPWDAQGE